MDSEVAAAFLRALGSEQIQVGSEWVMGTCPLAQWKHQNGRDTAPSCGIHLQDEYPHYYCFSCSLEVQPLSRLIHTYWLNSGSYPHRAARILAGVMLDDPHHDLLVPQREYRPPKPLPSALIGSYPLLAHTEQSFEANRCRDYLKQRSISLWAASYLQVRYFHPRQTFVFGYTDRMGRIFYLRHRSRKDKVMFSVNANVAYRDTGKVYSPDQFSSSSKVGAWFGLHLIDFSKPVTLVEGEIDLLRLISLGCFNVIASGGTSVTKLQLQVLETDRLILGYDSDRAGDRACERILKNRSKGVRLLRADWSQVDYVDDTGVTRPCKDAGDLPNKEALQQVLSSLKCLT